MILSMVIAGTAIITLAAISDKEIVYVDSNVIQLITYGGLGVASLYFVYQLSKVFLLF